MKKTRILAALMAVAVLLMTACNTEKPVETPPDDGPVSIDKLSIAFVPTVDTEKILTSTEPLKQLLIDELANSGFAVGEVEITVGTSQEAVGESLSAGSVDIGFGGASLYVTYDDEVQLLLTATRYGFTKTSDNPKDWNDGTATETGTNEVIGYAGLIYAGPSAKGKALAEKVNSGEALTWEDLADATWAVGNTTSNAGYIYPCLWLKNNYDKLISDLPTVIPGTNYPTMFAQAAAEQIDVFMAYCDARTGYVDQWVAEMGREASVWEEVQVIGISDWIVNDVVVGSKTSDNMQVEGLAAAIQQAMINIAKTDAGKEAISVYSHIGYVIGNDSDYDTLRDVQELVKSIG